MYLILIDYIANYSICLSVLGVLPPWLSGKESACSAEDTGDVGLIPGSGRSPGGGNGNPLQYSCLENPMDGGAWQATVIEVTKSQTRLSNYTLVYLDCYTTDWVAYKQKNFISHSPGGWKSKIRVPALLGSSSRFRLPASHCVFT